MSNPPTLTQCYQRISSTFVLFFEFNWNKVRVGCSDTLSSLQHSRLSVTLILTVYYVLYGLVTLIDSLFNLHLAVRARGTIVGVPCLMFPLFCYGELSFVHAAGRPWPTCTRSSISFPWRSSSRYSAACFACFWLTELCWSLRFISVIFRPSINRHEKKR